MLPASNSRPYQLAVITRYLSRCLALACRFPVGGSLRVGASSQPCVWGKSSQSGALGRMHGICRRTDLVVPMSACSGGYWAQLGRPRAVFNLAR